MKIFFYNMLYMITTTLLSISFATMSEIKVILDSVIRKRGA